MSSERRGYGVPRAKLDQEAPGLRRRRRRRRRGLNRHNELQTAIKTLSIARRRSLRRRSNWLTSAVLIDRIPLLQLYYRFTYCIVLPRDAYATPMNRAVSAVAVGLKLPVSRARVLCLNGRANHHC